MQVTGKTFTAIKGNTAIVLVIETKLAKKWYQLCWCCKNYKPTPKIYHDHICYVLRIKGTGNKGHTIQCDIRYQGQVSRVVIVSIKEFGGVIYLSRIGSKKIIFSKICLCRCKKIYLLRLFAKNVFLNTFCSNFYLHQRSLLWFTSQMILIHCKTG